MGWDSKPFAECVYKLKSQVKIQKSDFLASGSVPIVSQESGLINGYWNNTSDACNVDSPVIVFGDHTRVVKYIDFSFVIGADGVKIIKAKPFISTKYLYYYILFSDIKHLGYARHYRLLREIAVEFPSISEQRRIVAILDDAFERIDKAIANTEKNIANVTELIERTIVDAVFGEPDEKSWDLLPVKNLAATAKGAIRTGPFGSQLLHSEFVDSGIAVLGIDNAVQNEFKWGKSRFITHEKYKQLSRYTVHPGDVLITIMGTCGRCAVVPDDIPTAINTKHLCCITLNKTKCTPEFLHDYFLYHPISRNYLTAKAKGAIMAGLNMEIIKMMPVALPSLSRQRSMSQDIASLSTQKKTLITTYQNKITSLQTLKQSLLAAAFSGELTADFTPDALEL